MEIIPLIALSKDTTSEFARLSSHYPFSTLNIKQGSCEYQVLKSFGADSARESKPGLLTMGQML